MIRPEDRRPPVKLELEISAALADRLTAFSEALASSKEYIVRASLEESLPPVKSAARARAKAAAK
jgi:hypothetical protein